MLVPLKIAVFLALEFLAAAKAVRLARAFTLESIRSWIRLLIERDGQNDSRGGDGQSEVEDGTDRTIEEERKKEKR